MKTVLNKNAVWRWLIGLSVVIIAMSFLIAWLVWTFTWWSIVGAFWAFLFQWFVCATTIDLLGWLMKNDPHENPLKEH